MLRSRSGSPLDDPKRSARDTSPSAHPSTDTLLSTTHVAVVSKDRGDLHGVHRRGMDLLLRHPDSFGSRGNLAKRPRVYAPLHPHEPVEVAETPISSYFTPPIFVSSGTWNLMSSACDAAIAAGEPASERILGSLNTTTPHALHTSPLGQAYIVISNPPAVPASTVPFLPLGTARKVPITPATMASANDTGAAEALTARGGVADDLAPELDTMITPSTGGAAAVGLPSNLSSK
jgi:hypothetical protein